MGQFFEINAVGLIGVIIAIIIPIGIYFKEKKRKELSYEIISATSLINDDDEIRKRIKITFDDNEIKQNIHLVLLRIKNTGTSPIEAKDFTEPINIDTDEEGSILVIEKKESFPSNLRLEIDTEVANLFDDWNIKGLLLNPKDEFTLKLLIQSYTGKLSVTSRIVGVKEIIKAKDISILWDLFIPGVMSVASFSIGIASLLNRALANNIVFVVTLMLVLIMGLIRLLRFKIIKSSAK